MNILVSFNDAFTMPTKVMLKSLIHNNTYSEFDIYIMHENLSDCSIKSIRELEALNVRLHFIHINYEMFSDFPVTETWSRDVYVRLFAQNYLDDSLERILYLDGDIIVNMSIEKFYNQEFDGKYYIAVEDFFLGKSVDRHRELNMPLSIPYVNTGVLLINMKQIRENVDTRDIFSFISNNCNKLEYMDQDVLNSCFFQHIKVVEGFWYNYTPKQVKWRERHEWTRYAKIVHYAGKKKPWKKGYRYVGYQLWWKYALMAGEENKMSYQRNFLSSLGGRFEHGVAMFMEDKMPSIYPVVANVYMKRKSGGQALKGQV